MQFLFILFNIIGILLPVVSRKNCFLKINYFFAGGSRGNRGNNRYPSNRGGSGQDYSSRGANGEPSGAIVDGRQGGRQQNMDRGGDNRENRDGHMDGFRYVPACFY